MIRPVDAAISQRFGDNPTRNLPWNSWLIQTFGNYQPDGHSGEDYACDPGTPVRAVTSGTVLHIGWMGGTYDQNPWWIAPNFAGYCAVIDHGAFIGIYGHCQDGSAKVRKGDRVTEGQVFILSGNTGGSTGPHLHFEILPDGYILQSGFYGRIDPATIFTGSLSYAGTTTTQLEDDLSAVEVDAIITETNKQKEDLKAQVFARLDEAVLNLRQNIADTAGVDRQFLSDRIREQSPASIAVQINAAGIAKEVQAELVKLIGGK